MKLYLSSYRIPVANELAKLLGKSLAGVKVALLPNAKDYYSNHPWTIKVESLVSYMEELGLNVTIVDLRDYNDSESIKQKLSTFDLVWAMGGNSFVLRYEMQRSGFDKIIKTLLDQGIVYGGDSAGALVAGLSLKGIESADEPEFAEVLIEEGMGLVPFHILPHIDNPEFSNVVPTFKALHQGKEIIELKDSQAVIFEDEIHYIITAKVEI